MDLSEGSETLGDRDRHFTCASPVETSLVLPWSMVYLPVAVHPQVTTHRSYSRITFHSLVSETLYCVKRDRVHTCECKCVWCVCVHINECVSRPITVSTLSVRRGGMGG